jgi:hypothetical protein
MKKMRPKVNVLFALELLDDMVRHTSIGPSYVESPTQQAVADAIRRAKKRSQPKGIEPRRDQLPLLVPRE